MDGSKNIFFSIPYIEKNTTFVGEK